VNVGALAAALGLDLGQLDPSGGPSKIKLAARASGDPATGR